MDCIGCTSAPAAAGLQSLCAGCAAKVRAGELALPELEVHWPFGLEDRSAEQLRWMRRGLEMLTAVRMVRRDELAGSAFADLTEGLTPFDVGRLLAALVELLDRLFAAAGASDAAVQSWLDLLGQSLAVAEDLAAVLEAGS